MTPLQTASATRDKLNARAKEASAKLQTYPRGATGITPDAIKFSPEYQADLRAYRGAEATLRTFNAGYVKTFKTELAAERRAKQSKG